MGAMVPDLNLREAEEDVPPYQTAWVYREYGPKEKLSLELIKVPKLQGDQVLVKVKAAAICPLDSKRREGFYRRLDSKLPHVPGYDVAGVVVKCGTSFSKFSVGSEVYGCVHPRAMYNPGRLGSLAQYVAVQERQLWEKPVRLSFIQAAGMPLAMQTAQGALEAAQFMAGQRVLVLGGAGGVGTMAVQIAKHMYGASRVAATTSSRKIKFLRSIGCDYVVDYGKWNYVNMPHRYDLVLDTVGDSKEALRVIKEFGSVVQLAEETRSPTRPTFRFVVDSRGATLGRLQPFIDSGQIKPIVDPAGPFRFSEVIDAFEHLESKRAVGKVVIVVDTEKQKTSNR